MATTRLHVPIAERYISAAEAAERLGVCVKTIHRKVASGELKCYYDAKGSGRIKRFRLDEVQDFFSLVPAVRRGCL